MSLFRFEPQDTGVTCPRCAAGALLIRRTCMQVDFVCQSCKQSFLLAKLSRLLDDDAFGALAETVRDRLCDRV